MANLNEAADFTALRELIANHNSFIIFGHINPDGDSIGAMCAAALILETMGKTDVRLYSRDGKPTFLSFLPGADRIQNRQTAGKHSAEVALLLDCGGPKRIGDEFLHLLESAGTVAVVDHHATNGGFGKLNIIDPDASSTCEILARFVLDSKIEVSAELATCLYTGIMYDTGRFLHSNTTSAVFQACAELVRFGADPSDIAAKVFKQRSQARLRMLGYALNNLHTAENNAISWTTIERKVFEDLSAIDEDTEGIVEEIGAYAGCEAHVVFGQTPEGRTRVSMRSAGRVNVGDICAEFGGGGHDYAAGFRSKEPIE
ncbi:MAG: bifunctional oligoribonuclease/PAP phosphatase NrnA, partial [bacterium]